MFKSLLKPISFTILIIGIAMLMSGGKVHASGTGCPNPPNDTFNYAQNVLNWGVTPQYNGQHGGSMAGMIVHAWDATNKKELDMSYHLHSQVYDDPNKSANINGTNTNLNYRIFEDFQGDFSNRVGDKESFTNSSLWSSSGGFSCHGWDAFGPAVPFGGEGDVVGNGYVLDCGPEDQSTHFWFTNLSNPSNDGVDGQKGYWEIQVVYGDQHQFTLNINPYSAGSMGYKNNDFHVVNGTNTFVNFIWHSQPSPQPPQGSCTFIDVNNTSTYNGHNKRTHVVVNVVHVGGFKNNTDPKQDVSYDNIDQYVPSESGETQNGRVTEKQWWYQPQQNAITAYVTTQYHDSNGWHDIATTNVRTTAQPCFSSSCSISQVVGDGPNNVVLAGHTMKVFGSYTNTSPPPDYMILWNPAVQVDGSQVASNNGVHTLFLGPFYSGNTAEFEMDLTAPPNVTTDNLTVTPVYFGPDGPACNASIPIYQHFVLDPHATLTYNTAENPGVIGYSTYIQNNSSGSVSAPTTSKFTVTPFGGGTRCNGAGPVNSNGPYNPGQTYTINPSTCNSPTFNAGDQFCSQIDLTSFSQGYVGPGGAVIPSAGTTATDNKCVTVVNKPYFKTYNGSISAGGNFSDSGNCTGGGLLAGWNDNTGSQSRGSGSQLSALALIKITGVASAQSGAVSSSPPGTGLTFANTNNNLTNGPDAESPVLGGNFDNTGGSHCLDDASLPKSGGNVENHSSSTTINGRTVSGDQSVFVTGDAYVSGNITYGSNWPADNKPSFVLHATGNIYIAPGVTELDGIYIAKNKIYTCGVNNGNNNFTFMSAANLYSQCNTQLIVYGSFVAQQVNLMRTYGSLRNATSGEQATSGSLSCSYSGGPGNKPSCAGEIFILTPEVYLTSPAINLPSNGATQYDAITSLPPVL